MLPILSVSEFLEQINGIIAGEFVVEGEISQYKISQGKWVFFDLKDDKSVVNCFATVYGLKTPLADGMKVRVTGYPKVREQSGRFSLTVQQVELVGEGSLKKAYLLLKEKLAKEGLFNLDRKRALPNLPQKIGVIASKDSAAWGDFWRILNNRWRGIEVELLNVAVQGERAIEEIVGAFEYFNKEKNGCELVVLIRGGGSLEDLAAFNAEEVVRAVYGSRIPVVVGVGHERDESLADFAADLRASTPSNAAELVTPNLIDFISDLELTQNHLQEKLLHKISRFKHLMEQSFFVIAGKFEQPLSAASFLVEQFLGCRVKLVGRFDYLRQLVNSGDRLLQNINPKKLLQRGYSIVRDSAGRLVQQANAVDLGERLVIELSEGNLTAEVVNKKK